MKARGIQLYVGLQPDHFLQHDAVTGLNAQRQTQFLVALHGHLPRIIAGVVAYAAGLEHGLLAVVEQAQGAQERPDSGDLQRFAGQPDIRAQAVIGRDPEVLRGVAGNDLRPSCPVQCRPVRDGPGRAAVVQGRVIPMSMASPASGKTATNRPRVVFTSMYASPMPEIRTWSPEISVHDMAPPGSRVSMTVPAWTAPASNSRPVVSSCRMEVSRLAAAGSRMN